MFLNEKYKVSRGLEDIETHEVFLDTLAHAKEEELGITEKKFEVKIKEKIIYFIFAVFFISSSFLLRFFFLKQRICRSLRAESFSPSPKAIKQE